MDLIAGRRMQDEEDELRIGDGTSAYLQSFLVSALVFCYLFLTRQRAWCLRKWRRNVKLVSQFHYKPIYRASASC